VIDPEMADEIRVTVVATGLGNVDIANARKSVDKTQKILAGDGTPDYAEFDKPTVIRNRGTLDDAQVGKTDMEYLDIPAFLRRQAD
jgi:cell division protein FtsZ